ncbi:MAG: hypothetical protein IKS55_10350 [Oscillospiraceae bacterium]|nr:hypothetical protein [Oscillospiraceae bacterium]
MDPELQEFRSGKKSLELICYIAGAGAFGVFLRWMQRQLAFNELGLAEKSRLHVALILFVLAAAVVFYRFIRNYEKARMSLPDDFSEAFSNPGRFYRIARIAAGLVVCAGAMLLFMQTGEDKHSTDYRILALCGLLSGIAFPFWLSRADRETETAPWLLCALSFLPMFFLAAWMVICYKLNTINSVVWSYGPELFTVAVAMFAFFRLGGWAFGRPSWKRCLFLCMFAAALCILNLADERLLGLQVIFLGLAAELILCCWIMVTNLQKGEAPPKKKKNTGGFEEL